MMTKKTFEQALAKLEQLVAELEQGDIALDSGLKKFDEGVQLAAFCSQKLHEARSRVDLLLDNETDGLTAVPFNTAGEN
ncbi:exodeoxyribonuclease VII small subunit [Candidatus Electronema sp. JM]|uniref:exodeoxyribonuclease VII small subunit n=1 Tax=Candidatus Electronema sp. JM TaxID=3401571 RepID=UPI003AA9056F